MHLKESLRQHEEDLQRVRELRLLDDDFMTMVFDGNIEATELLLNVIFGRTDMVVTEVVGQREIKNVSGRSVRLDIHAKDNTETRYDIEIQKEKRGANAKRARFNSSMMDTILLKPGQDFTELADTYVIFITENDVIGKGLALYHVNRRIEETKALFGDGAHIIYVNGAYENEADDVGKLMHDFRCKNASQMHFKVLSDKVRYFKETEGGLEDMGNVFEDIEARGETRGEARGLANGDHKARVEIAENMIQHGKVIIQEIADLTGLPLEEVSTLVHKETA